MSTKPEHLYNNDLEKATIGDMLLDPGVAIPVVKRYCNSKDFSGYRDLAEVLFTMHAENESVDMITFTLRLKQLGEETFNRYGGTTAYGSLVEATPSAFNVETHAKAVKELALKRGFVDASLSLASTAAKSDTDIETFLKRRTELETAMLAEVSRLHGGNITNPADDLEQMRGGFIVPTGIQAIDSLVLMSSGALHLVGGDPNSGKTTMGAQVAYHALHNDIPVHVLLVEDTSLEFKMNLLTIAEEISALDANRVLSFEEQRTPTRVQEIRDAWDRAFGDRPRLNIHIIDKGVEQALQVVAGIPAHGLVLVDHAFAVVTQTADARREYQEMGNLLNVLQTTSQAHDLCTIAFNQYTRSGRSGVDRTGDALWGGSGTFNIPKTIINMDVGDSDYNPLFQAVRFVIRKCKRRLVVGADGEPVNPVGREGYIYIVYKTRSIVSRPPNVAVPNKSKEMF